MGPRPAVDDGPQHAEDGTLGGGVAAQLEGRSYEKVPVEVTDERRLARRGSHLGMRVIADGDRQRGRSRWRRRFVRPGGLSCRRRWRRWRQREQWWCGGHGGARDGAGWLRSVSRLCVST